MTWQEYILLSLTKGEKERALLSRPSAAAAVKDRSSDCQAVAVNTNSSGYRQHYRHKSSSRSSRSPNLAWNGNVMQSADQFDPRRNIFQRAKVKSLKISILIVSAFVVCWAPYYFMMITFIFLKPDQQVWWCLYDHCYSQTLPWLRIWLRFFCFA